METNVTPIIAEFVTKVKYIVQTNEITNTITNHIDEIVKTNWVNPEKLGANQIPEAITVSIIGAVLILVFGWVCVTIIKNNKEG